MLKRNEKLIRTKLWQYLLPGVMLTAAVQLGNVVDTMLVGSILGTDAMSAVKIGMTIDNIMELPGYVLAVGGGVAAGLLLGRRERERADRVFSATFLVSAVCGVLFALLSVFSPFLARLLTGGGPLEADTCAFVRVTLLGAPVIGTALQFINYVSVDNCPGIASVYVIVSNVLNLTLDYLLLKFTPLGTAGAALSTILGYSLATVVLIPYFRSSRRMLHFTKLKKGLPDALKLAFTMGLPTLSYMIFDTVRVLALNTLILRAMGEASMAVFTVCDNVVLIVQMLVGGIIDILPTVGSVIYGEKDYFGVRTLVRYVLRYSYGVLAVLMLVLAVFTRQTVGLFGISEGPLLAMAVPSLRLFLFSLPFYVFNSFTFYYYQSTEKEKLSSLVTALRSCVAVLPPAFLLVLLTGPGETERLRALMIALILGEALTAFIVEVLRRCRYRGEGLLLLPAAQDEQVLDISIDPAMEETARVPQEISAFCRRCGVDGKKANLIAVAAEEMTVNIIQYGGRRVRSIDINLTVTQDRLILRTRDNGIPFDPTHYELDAEAFEIHGIELIKRISDKVQYLRVLDLNNTTVEVALGPAEAEDG